MSLQNATITVTLNGKQIEPVFKCLTSDIHTLTETLRKAFGLEMPQHNQTDEWSVFINQRYIGSTPLLDRNALRRALSLCPKLVIPKEPEPTLADGNLLHLVVWNYNQNAPTKAEYRLTVGHVACIDTSAAEKELVNVLNLTTVGNPADGSWQFFWLGDKAIGWRKFDGHIPPFHDIYNVVEKICPHQYIDFEKMLTLDQLIHRGHQRMVAAMKDHHKVEIPVDAGKTTPCNVFISYPWDPVEGVHFETVKSFGQIQERLRRRLRTLYVDDAPHRSPIHFQYWDGTLNWVSTRYLSLRGSNVEMHQIKSVYADVVAEISIPNTSRFGNEPGWAYGYEQPPAGMLPHIEHIAVVQSPQGTKMAWVATPARGGKDIAAINTFLSTVLPPERNGTAIYHISREERKPYHWYGCIDGEVAYRVIMGETYGVVLDWDDELLSRQDVETIFYVWGL